MVEFKNVSKASFVSPMNVILETDHNIRKVLFFESGLRDVAQELGELCYHIDIMCV